VRSSWSEREAQATLEKKLGPLAKLARGAGRYSVILMNDELCSSGTTITEEHKRPGDAVRDALAYVADGGVDVS
jgi:hypothetical protein